MTELIERPEGCPEDAQFVVLYNDGGHCYYKVADGRTLGRTRRNKNWFDAGPVSLTANLTCLAPAKPAEPPKDAEWRPMSEVPTRAGKIALWEFGSERAERPSFVLWNGEMRTPYSGHASSLGGHTYKYSWASLAGTCFDSWRYADEPAATGKQSFASAIEEWPGYVMASDYDGIAAFVPPPELVAPLEFELQDDNPGRGLLTVASGNLLKVWGA